MKSKIERLRDLGQSAWLDYLDHDLITSGELDRLIEQEGIRGMTSNPTIFQKAIAKSKAYDFILSRAQASEPDASVLERIMVGDIRAACDRFKKVYDDTEGRDGFVSIEVSPAAARDTERSIEEAHRLWFEVDRPNLFVKIPGTEEGLPAIERCLIDGLNINITLLFSVQRYLEVANAYMRALEIRGSKGQPIDRIASVASFFVSRVDTKVDEALGLIPNALQGAAGALRGQIGIANAKIAYEEYETIIESDRWKRLADKGARPQRLLWASTSPKDPAYRDTYYVDTLIGRDTVDTMTRETIDAYLDHGQAEDTLARDRSTAHQQLATLKSLAIDLDAITSTLEDEGIDSFAKSYDEALSSIRVKRRNLAA